MPKKAKPEKQKRETQDYSELIDEARAIQDFDYHHLVMPADDNLWENAEREYEGKKYTAKEYFQDYKGLLKNLKPKNFKDLTQMVSSFPNPSGYMIVKMPNRMHYNFNKLLDYASETLARKGAVEPAVAAKVASGLSKMIYAAKTHHGKYLTHGLQQTLDGLEETGDEKVMAFAKSSRKVFENHLSKKGKMEMAA